MSAARDAKRRRVDPDPRAFMSELEIEEKSEDRESLPFSKEESSSPCSPGSSNGQNPFFKLSSNFSFLSIPEIEKP